MVTNLNQEKVLAIIPARGGSKGVLHKNIRLLSGRPLVAHTIEHALKAKRVNRLAITTDDSAIGKIALEAGAEVIWRPVKISGDDATSESALLHALNYLEQKDGYKPDIVVFLQCTSPVRTALDIDKAICTFKEGGLDSLFSVSPSHRFIWRLVNGGPRALNYDFQTRARRQDYIKEFVENGSIYVFKPWVLQELNNRLGGKMGMYVMDYWSSFEIDTEEDFALCKWILIQKKRQLYMKDVLPNKVDLIALDFDGVFTNNKVVVHDDGTEAIICDRSDGMGVARLRDNGFNIVVLSTEENPVVAKRCNKLGIKYFQALGNRKASILSDLIDKHNLNFQNVIYVGNDVNDLECFRIVGCAIAVADAHYSVLAAAHLVLQNRGGYGAIRELSELLMPEEIL